MRTLLPLISLCLFLSCGSAPFQATRNSSSQPPIQTSLNRRIELMVRSQFSVPPACEIKIGPRGPSDMPGYDTLRVTLMLGARNSQFDFLISKDNATLVHVDKFDLNANPALSINLRGRPVRGNPSAPVTVVNYDDLECPVCAYLHKQLFPAVFDRYGDQVRFIYKDNPLVEMHPWALHAAVDAACLAGQSAAAYWQYVDYVHAHGDEVSGQTRDLRKSFSALDHIASEQSRFPGVDANQLQSCLKKQVEAPVRQSMKEAGTLGLNFTPALFVNGEEVRGYTTNQDLWRVIDRALLDTGTQPPGQAAPTRAK